MMNQRVNTMTGEIREKRCKSPCPLTALPKGLPLSGGEACRINELF